ncbi:MAG: BatD family protein, partial [Verrucomicrobiota bacterium]
LIGKSAQGRQYRTQVGNHVYTVIPISYALTVTRSGPLTLGPFTANAVVIVPMQNQNDGDPFRQFFNQGEQKQVSLATESVKVESLPLPDRNKPANFSGAIGNFTMTASVGPTNVTAGDPVTVHVQISGRGSFDSITLPDQSALAGFKIFPPTVKTELSDQTGLSGTKTFEEIVTPQSADIHEWPQFSFSFFNPDDGRYHTLTQPAVALAVHSAGSTPLPAFAKNSAPENQAPADILPNKENLGSLRSETVPLIARPAFLALQSLPVLAFVAAFIWRKRTDSLANNPRRRRQRAVAQIISSGLLDLKKSAAENKPDEFFATLFRLLQEQLGERLDCPASAITENVIEEQPVLRNAPPATRDGLRELFQLCNQARYAPVRGTAELNSVAAQFQKIIGELQDLQA